MSLNLENRVRALEEVVPGGYRTFDRDGRVVINSTLPALEWMRQTEELLSAPGRQNGKAELLWKLRTSAGYDNGGGRLYELVAVHVVGYLKPHELRELAELALRNHRVSPGLYLREFLAGFLCPDELEQLFRPPDSAPGGPEQ